MATVEIKKITRKKPSSNQPTSVDAVHPKNNKIRDGLELASIAKKPGDPKKTIPSQKTTRQSTAPLLPDFSSVQATEQNDEPAYESAVDQEQDWSRSLAQDRINDLRNKTGFKETYHDMVGRLDNPELELDSNENMQYLKKIQHAVTSGSKLQAIKAGAEIGADLRHRIATGSFQGFLFAMGLAITKDLWDLISEWFDVGLTGALFNMLITTALLMIVMFQGIWFKRFLIKRFWKRFILVIIAEFIPILAFFPFWAISVWLVKRQADKKRKQHEGALEALEKDIKNLRNAK